MTTYYKVLGLDNKPFHGGTGEWFVPQGKRPGKWMPKIAEIEPCVSGYHLCEEQDLVDWLGPAIYVAKGRGNSVRDINKTVWQQARLVSTTNWSMETMVQFAQDCADHVSHLDNEWAAQAAAQAAARAARGAARAAQAAAAREARGAQAAAQAAARAVRAARGAERAWQTQRLMELIK